MSAPTRFWRDGRLLVTRTFRSASALPVVAARLSAQARATPTVMTVPDGLLMSGMHNRMWWSVHLQDANGAGAYRTQGTMVGSLMLLDADGVTPLRLRRPHCQHGCRAAACACWTHAPCTVTVAISIRC
ncbi:hypothetical protein [Pigmentiphaga litoralis]|uniref:hypothetical protein n=1 Tax=Pigmentiphaga litoralis TaxID=516702 RepID=UPI003B439A55